MHRFTAVFVLYLGYINTFSKAMVKFYKFCFYAYLVSLLVLVAFNVYGDIAAGYAGDTAGLEPITYAFIGIAAVTIILSIIIMLPRINIDIKHKIHYIISVLIFIILCFDVYWLYNEIADQDYSPFFGFVIFFIVASAVSFYALVKKII